jgi:SanA protein
MVRRRLMLVTLMILLAMLAGLGLVRHDVHRHDHRILTQLEALDTSQWPRPRVAVVFGASVYSNGDLSPMLEDRVKMAIALYRAQKIDRILVSGDNRTPSYNEPKAMQDYLLSHAVAPRDVFVDYAGRSTYETCHRARDIFGLRQAVLITQKFHLPRALYLAHSFGIDAYGVAADQQPYGSLAYQRAREVGAEIKACFNVHVSPPQTILGNKMPIE